MDAQTQKKHTMATGASIAIMKCQLKPQNNEKDNLHNKNPKICTMKTKSEEMHLRTLSLPKYVGSYSIGKGEDWLHINFTHKPNWFHRTMMKICFGIRWFDIKTKEQ